MPEKKLNNIKIKKYDIKSKTKINRRTKIAQTVNQHLSQLLLKGHSSAELHIYFLVRLESIYYQIFFYSKIVPNCAVAK